MDSEARLLRERQADADDAIDQQSSADSDGSLAILAQTTTVTTYPTTASAFYACIPQWVDGSETEGASPSYTASGRTIFALNVGSAIPPSGTTVIAHSTGGRWSFRWDG